MSEENATTGAAPAGKAGMPGWARKVVAGLILAVVLVITYFILAAFLPRWWAQQAGALSSGSFTRGIAWGLMYGVLCTVVPLLLFYLAWRVRGRKHGRVVQVVAVILGIVAALPNLLTLTVVFGGNTAAHAGERILDVDAPGFRGASLVGAIIGALAFAVFVARSVSYRRRGAELARMRGEERARREAVATDAEVASGPDEQG
ncbi:hypothetical protein [Rhodococcus sp. UNC363MFTsu5.1]|uniref:hypothetical protein n=1 Tax=Rhodococcus sp. UNC363MFTsu5.1 TaxID=1449069 RepID=UPI000485C403|nr:hypothetical protein [Rhodococcus sp. UNC363MFTsu5.1]